MFSWEIPAVVVSRRESASLRENRFAATYECGWCEFSDVDGSRKHELTQAAGGTDVELVDCCSWVNMKVLFPDDGKKRGDC